MKSNAKTFAVGMLGTSRTGLYSSPAKYKAVINMFRLVKKLENDVTISIWINHAGKDSYLLPPNLELHETYMVDIVDPEQPITLHAGDFISAQCSSANTVDFILAGEQYEDI